MSKSDLLEKLRYLNIPDNVVNAFSVIQREDFIPSKLKHMSYSDIALPIGQGQTISQPSTIAIMFSILNPQEGHKVLEIGSGCGYVLALLSRIVGSSGEIFGIEVVPELAEKSKLNLIEYRNIKVQNKNGSQGLIENAPFDRIIISAALNEIPRKISAQLKEGGILVAPVGNKNFQNLIAIQRINNKFIIKNNIPGFVFVPFVGK